MKKYVYLVVSALIFFSGCKEHYDLPSGVASQSLLVVEGMLNSGNEITNIRLSRSSSLNRSTDVQPELHAQLKVEGSDSSSVPLADNGDGFYAAQLSLNPSILYRLHIHTSNGTEYLSDFVPVKPTPDIDSLSWRQQDGNVIIFANTHDPQNNTWYYKWDYTETWEILSSYNSYYKYENNQVRRRIFPGEQALNCWKGNKSSNILLGSSIRLQSDVITEAPLLQIPNASEKIAVRYSILVRQYALTKEAYDFFQVMKRNTENLGTIFDPQPSETRGNIHNVNKPDERVIGWITASNVHEKRIFISNSQLKNWIFSMYCPFIQVQNNPDSIHKYFTADYSPIDSSDLGYSASSPHCVDCTTRGGLPNKPSFW
jgi:hypothetical protein